jgi:hypothetical protein
MEYPETSPPQHVIDQKRRNRMALVDAMSAEMRETVNDYGFHIVDNFMKIGIHKPKQIRHLVEIILDEFSPTRGTKSKQGIRTEVVQHLRAPE